MCVTFAVAVCNQFALFLLIYTTEECADSAVFANWQFCESQGRIYSVMSHVAPTRTLLMLNSLFLLLSRPSVSNHVTHSRVLCSSSSTGLLSTSDPTIEKQDVVDPPYKIVIRSYDKYMINTVLFLKYLCL